MHVIWKYELDVGYNSLNLPIGSKVLSIQSQYEKITMWVLVNKDMSSLNQHEFLVIGTGLTFEKTEKMQFLATVQVGEFVWHVFKVKNESDI